MIDPIKTRVMMLVARGVVEKSDDSTDIQSMKATFLAGETRDKMERFQNFGFSSSPPANSECVAVFPGGNRDHALIVAVDHRASRVKGLAPGESVMHNQAGQKMHMKANGDLEGSVKKFKMENDTGELITEISALLTSLAGEPFIVNKTEILRIKAIVDSFKI